MTPLQRKTAAAAIATTLAISAEGLRHYAYYDPPGILTVCYGSTTNVERNKFYTMEECSKRLTVDMMQSVTTVDKCVPGLPVNVLAVFSDAVYNSGPKIACDLKNSTAARYLKTGQLIAACNQLPRWDKAKILGVHVSLPGLTTRREREKTICLKGLT